MCPALRRPGFRVAAEAKMRRALAVPTPLGDVPVGAVIFDPDGNVIGRGSNRREADGDPTAHAEIIAIREAVRNFHDGWRLTDCTIAVTLEPWWRRGSAPLFSAPTNPKWGPAAQSSMWCATHRFCTNRR